MATYAQRVASQPCSRVEIITSCNNLLDKDITSKSDPCLVLSMQDKGQWYEVRAYGCNYSYIVCLYNNRIYRYCLLYRPLLYRYIMYESLLGLAYHCCLFVSCFRLGERKMWKTAWIRSLHTYLKLITILRKFRISILLYMTWTITLHNCQMMISWVRLVVPLARLVLVKDITIMKI